MHECKYTKHNKARIKIGKREEGTKMIVAVFQWIQKVNKWIKEKLIKLFFNRFHLYEHRSSPIGSKISKIANILRKPVLDQIYDYQLKFSKVTDRYHYLFKDLIVDKYDLRPFTPLKIFWQRITKNVRSFN